MDVLVIFSASTTSVAFVQRRYSVALEAFAAAATASIVRRS